MALIDDIAGLVADGLVDAEMTKPATLIKITHGARQAGNLAGGRQTIETSFAAQGLVVSTRLIRIGATLVAEGDRVIKLFGATIKGGQVPKTNDKITIEGVTTRIVDTERDAASAAYTCLTRS